MSGAKHLHFSFTWKIANRTGPCSIDFGNAEVATIAISSNQILRCKRLNTFTITQFVELCVKNQMIGFGPVPLITLD